jgi:hypothetical protein
MWTPALTHKWRHLQTVRVMKGCLLRSIDGVNKWLSPARASHLSMTWAQRLQRVFKIDILTCEYCGGAVKLIASIEDPVVLKTIFDHLARRASLSVV